MRAKYFPNLFKAKYPVLKGSDWIRTIDDEDLQFFIREGLKAADYGKMGGNALLQKYNARNAEGKNAYLSSIGRIGAIMSNIRRQWNRAVKEETEKELGITLDY